MKLLRFLVVVAVLAYAGWLAWPFLAPFIEGAGQPEAAVRAGPAAPGKAGWALNLPAGSP